MEEHVRKELIDALDPNEAVNLTKQMVDIPSPEGEELECARFLYEYMRQAGVEVQLQEVEEGRANVIATVRGAGDGPTLMLNGHLDRLIRATFGKTTLLWASRAPIIAPKLTKSAMASMV
jgi:arginine utilization protein RocB